MSSGGSFANGMFRAAVQFIRSGQFQKAEEPLLNIISKQPRDFDANHMLGVVYSELGKTELAEKHFKSASSIAPNHPPLYQNWGLSLSKQNHFEEAIDKFNMAIRLAPNFPPVYSDRGNALKELGRYREAIIDYNRAINLAPQFFAFYSNRGNTLREQKEYTAALSDYDRAIQLNPNYADTFDAFNGRGNVFRDLKRYDEALAAYDKALSIKPNLAEAWLGRGNVFRDLKRYDEAFAAYDKALAIKPDLEDAWVGRGNVFYDLKRYDEALAAIDTALGLKPDFANAFNNRGLVLERLERFEEALASCDKAIALKRDFAEAFRDRGLALVGLKRFEEALASYDKAIALKLDAAAFGNRGDTLLTLGRLEEATESFERATALEPTEVRYHLSLVNSRRVTAADPHFTVMKELAREEESLDAERKIELHFGLGKAFADLGDYKQSFHHLLKANSLKRQQLDYNGTKTLGLFDRIRAVFTAELLREKGGLGDPSRLPVFVVGMPRSGTTLVEQILASHPSIFGAGELREFGDLATSIRGPNLREFPEAVATMSGAELRALGARFLQMIQQMAPAAERITDKMPANFRYAGLIHLALPNARIIHVCRDPRDVALSCFSLLFFKDRLPFSYYLPELGRYIRAYQALMEHWREVLPRGVMLEVQYEEVVDNLAEQAQRIVAHCGLPWDAACLEFHKTDRAVRTASVTQVRRPIYRNSVGRWRDYEEFLQPLLRELEDHST
jgi:tetratricopeptide (TPR) repeat protein